MKELCIIAIAKCDQYKDRLKESDLVKEFKEIKRYTMLGRATASDRTLFGVALEFDSLPPLSCSHDISVILTIRLINIRDSTIFRVVRVAFFGHAQA